MSVAKNVAEILKDHVTLTTECIDRMYLNVYVPQLQREGGIATFWRYHRGNPFASSVLMDPMSKEFVAKIERYARLNDVPIVSFKKGQRKDDVAKEYLKGFRQEDGILFIGKAQEKAPVCRTERRLDPKTGKTYPWLYRSTAMVNHFYFYGVDSDFGPFFLKFCTYFPYNAKLYMNGHEWLKRQLERKGIGFEALDNGLLSCEDPKRMQALADQLSPQKIDALLRKWLSRLPHPFTAADRQAGYRYHISILQAEFSLTQVLDRPVTGRIFFEDVIRDNLDMGRPDQVQLIFSRRINKRTPGKFRTRVITEGVVPSLHVDYKNTRIKQYHKEGQALRTETTINNTRDFGIGKNIKNLPALRQVGFNANRRLLDVQTVTHDCAIGEETLQHVITPQEVAGQRVSALHFGDTRVQALLSLLVVFCLQPRGFNNAELRERLATLLGFDPAHYSSGKMTYDLRRLRLHGLIQRIPRTHRYEVTSEGLRVALLFSRVYGRLFRSTFSDIMPQPSPPNSPLRKTFEKLEMQIEDEIMRLSLVA